MENEEKILTKEEKRQEFKKKFLYWKKVMFPDERKTTNFISMMLIDPLLVIIFAFYMTTKIINIPITYICVDSLIILWWIHKGLERKKLWEEMAIDRTESIRQKIAELGAIEAERRRQELIEQENKQNKKNKKKKRGPWI